MYVKKLVGEKCYLAPLDLKDAEKFVTWINDMEVSIGLTMSSLVLTEEVETEMLAKLQKTEYNFSIVDKKTDILLGSCGFVSLNNINRTGEVGIILGNKKSHSMGYGEEALNLLMDFGFNILNLNSIHLRVFSYNKIAINSYKKLGFQEAGRLREAKIIGGHKYDEIYMDMLAEEFTYRNIRNILDSKNMDRKLFIRSYQQSLTYDEFIAGVEAEYQLEFKRFEDMVRLDDAKVFARGMEGVYHILVFAEGFCPDCHINLPPIHRLSQVKPEITLRILPREENKELMAQLLPDLPMNIPAVVLLDDSFRILGRIIERPQRVKYVLQNNPEEGKIEYLEGNYVLEVLKDLRDLSGKK